MGLLAMQIRRLKVMLKTLNLKKMCVLGRMTIWMRFFGYFLHGKERS
jgi:hypothetical protein